VKRLALAATTLVAVAVPGVAQAQLSHQETTAYGRAYWAVQHRLGPRAAGCKLIGPHASCADSTPSDTAIRKSTDVLHRMLAPPPAPAPAPAPAATHSSTTATSSVTSSYSGGGYSNVPGVPSSFAACVAMRESTNGAGSSNIYGIQGPGGQGSLAEQKQAFAQMYAARGTQPWSPYDGC